MDVVRQLEQIGSGVVRDLGDWSLGAEQAATKRQRFEKVSSGSPHEPSYRELEVCALGRKVISCTRQAVISETNSSFSFRQSISWTVLNAPSCLPACPNLPIIEPSSSILKISPVTAAISALLLSGLEFELYRY